MRRIATSGDTGPVRWYCRVPDCPNERRPDDLMCKAHWQRVPRPIRQAVWRAFDTEPGSPRHLILCGAALRLARRGLELA